MGDLVSAPVLVVSVESPFDEAFVNALKSIPFQEREYEESRRRWWFTEARLEQVKGIALAHFQDVFLVRGGTQENLRTGEVFEQPGLF